MKIGVFSAATLDREEKLRKELKTTAERWRWKFNLPHKPNYNNVYYYKKSKKIFNAPCYDLDLDRPPENYRGEFLQMKNVLHQSEFRLRRAQEDAKKKKEDLAVEWKELEAKETELRNNFILFNKFLSRNNTKRTRAEQKRNDMNALNLECTRKIGEMKTESENITAFVEKLKKRVLAYKIYEDYLNSVIMTGSFKTIPQVINRYVLLEETKQTVGKQMQKASEDFHNRRIVYLKMMEVAELKFLSLSNQLSEMRRKYDDSRYMSNAWEVVLQDICNKYAAAAQNISWSRMALRHMFDMAFYRIRRRRKRLVKTKKDDIGKMLRINETLKALERIEIQLRKLHGQKNVATSMDPERDAFEIKERTVSKPDVRRNSALGSKLKANRDQAANVKGGHRPGDLAGYLKLAMENETLEDVCPIKLDQDKWKHAKVKNFEEHYKQALLAIREEKLKEKLQDLTYGATGAKASYTSLMTPKSHKSKWVAAAAAQKMLKDVTIESPAASAFVMTSATSDSALAALEETEDILADFNTAARRLQIKKLIERKFTALLDTTSTRDLGDNKVKSPVTLPSILTGYQAKEREFVRKKIQELSPVDPYSQDTNERAIIVAPDRRVKSLAPTEKLPRLSRISK